MAESPYFKSRSTWNLRRYLFPDYDVAHDPYMYYEEAMKGISSDAVPQIQVALIHEQLNFYLDKFGY